MPKRFLTAVLLSVLLPLAALATGRTSTWFVLSPDGNTMLQIEAGDRIEYSLSRGGVQLLEPSEVAMTLSDGTVFGGGDAVRKFSKRSVDDVIPTTVYKKSSVTDRFNEVTLSFKLYDLIFRVYDDGVAYRFVAKMKNDFEVASETAQFNFAGDWKAYVPYVRDGKDGDWPSQFANSFENTYTLTPLSGWNKARMAFLPLTVEAPAGMKICVSESALTDYPGMYLINNGEGHSLKGVWPPYPAKVEQGGHNMLEGLVKSTEKYIAKASKDEAFPWRVVMVAAQDKDLLDSDMVWRLGDPQDPGTDFSWVKPGKVAWEWWNAWNISGVDFKSGINNDTYKFYIDFASANGIEYVILDEGWAVNLQADLMQVVPEIDIPMLARYAESKGVGLILWAGYWAFNRDMEGVCRYFSSLGVKGFKVDFMNRDDQPMVDFFSDVAAMCAKYHLMVDFHGAFKPSGLMRRFPNVVNYEGVHGLEQMKWTDADQVTYDVTIPFVRMAAGPFDYTQGAMHNANKSNFRAVYEEPMSQGTRCRQLAEYAIFDAPLSMLCDSPTNYIAEPECTSFIASFPTTWDETRALDGKISEYAAMARRKGSEWYVGALTDWNERDLTLDLGFIGEGGWKMEVFRDGVNADRKASDYKREVLDLPSDGKVNIHMAPGGGWVARIYR